MTQNRLLLEIVSVKKLEFTTFCLIFLLSHEVRGSTICLVHMLRERALFLNSSIRDGTFDSKF